MVGLGLSILAVSDAFAAGTSHFVLSQVTLDSPALSFSTEKPASFIIYDGKSYERNQSLTKDLNDAASRPFIHRAAKNMPNGNFVGHVSPDGHYYIPGDVNGFPVRFLVDSGAAYSSIPTRLALDAGMRVGVAKLVNTADGQVAIGETSGNVITIGSARIANVHIMVMDKLQTALLGAETLNALDISYSKGVMTIKANKNQMPIPIDALGNYQ